MKIVSIVGARPQFIKCAPVSRELRKEHEEILVHTGQHYDANMSDIFFEELSISQPDYNLGIGSGDQGEQTGRMLAEIEKVLLKEQPDIVLVYGDTNSTLAGALAAAKLHIPVAHVEAGLRSFDKTMPEEINRILTDHISDLLFCPTQTAVDNLKKEGITEEHGVYLTGDVMVDALQYNLKIAEEKSTIIEDLSRDLSVRPGSKPDSPVDLKNDGYYVATVHRASNTDSEENLGNIMKAFAALDRRVIFPAHPRTMKCLKQYGLYESITSKTSNICLIEPLPYLDMLSLMARATKILTDSGGIQKEAYILRVPCVTLRENTEWVETVEDGWNVLVGADTKKVINCVFNVNNDANKKGNHFGEGNSSKLISKLFMISRKNN